MSSKSISKSVIWQLGGKFALQGIAFFTTPIFTRLLSPADYGYTALYTSWLSILGLVIGLCVNGSIGNARITYGEDNLSKYVSSIMTISVFSFVAMLLISVFVNKPLSYVMGISPSLVVLVVVQSFFSFVINCEITRLDQLKKVEKSTLLSVSQSIVIIALSLIFVLIKEDNKAEAKIYGQAIPTFLFGTVLLVLIYIRGKTFWNSEYNKFCLAFTLPLIVHSAGHLIFSQSDRIMLQKIQGEALLGVYSVPFSLCGILTIIYGALNTAWVPFYYDLKRQEKIKEILSHSSRYIKFYTLISVAFIMLSFDVFKFMAPPDYYSGMKIIPLFVLSNFFGFLYLFPVNFEFYKRKTTLIPIATITAALINIGINWLLIPNYGILGAAIGTLIAHILLYLFHEIMARKIGSSEYEYRKSSMFLAPIFVMLVVCALMFFFYNIPFFFRWIVASSLGIWILIDFIKNRSVF